MNIIFMKRVTVFFCCIALIISLSTTAQNKIPAKFAVVVSFGSMAGGPSSDSFLQSFIKKFTKKYAVKMTGYKAAGCGREGEFNILFSTAGLKSSTKKKFINDINTTVTTQEKKNKAKDENSGIISVEYNKTKSDFSYCREGIAVWK